MEQLSDAMQAAAADRPPPAFDLDELIAGERRRARNRYRFGAVAGVAVLTAGAVAAPLVLSGGRFSAITGGAPVACPSVSYGPAPSPSGSYWTHPSGTATPRAQMPSLGPESAPPPTEFPPSVRVTVPTPSGSAPGYQPSWPPPASPSVIRSAIQATADPTYGSAPFGCSALMSRLDPALTRAVRGQLPNATVKNVDGAPGLFRADIDRSYVADVRLAESILDVRIFVGHVFSAEGAQCVPDACVWCTTSERGGVEVWERIDSEPHAQNYISEFVNIEKPDGTEVQLDLYPRVGSGVPLTIDQVVAIGLAPGLTLAR